MAGSTRVTTVVAYGLLASVAGISLLLPRTLSVQSLTAAPAPSKGDSVLLAGVVRDFAPSHPDFGVTPTGGIGHYAGNVVPSLGEHNVPAMQAGTAMERFDIVDNRVVPKGEFSTEIAVLGSALTAGSYEMPVTVKVVIGNHTLEPFGPYTDPAYGNVNDDESATGNVNPGDNPRKYVSSETFDANTAIVVHGKSWEKSSSSSSSSSRGGSSRGGSSTTSWSTNMEANSAASSPQIKVLRNGDAIPQIRGASGQDDVADYVADFVDLSTDTMKLLDNQVIYLFELGVSGTTSSADFQDLVVLISLGSKPEFFAGDETEYGGTAIAAGYKVQSQWKDAEGRNIAPHLASDAPTTDECGDAINDTAGSKGVNDNGAITSAESFSQWFRDVPGVNLSASHIIELVEDEDGVWEYATNEFYPIDDQMLDDGSGAHNFFFTYSFEFDFTYEACLGHFFEFDGSDDAWVFIDNQLVMDRGGVRPGTAQVTDLDRLHLSDGQTYRLRFFYAQRQTQDGSFSLRTNIPMGSVTSPQVYAVSDGFD